MGYQHLLPSHLLRFLFTRWHNQRTPSTRKNWHNLLMQWPRSATHSSRRFISTPSHHYQAASKHRSIWGMFIWSSQKTANVLLSASMITRLRLSSSKIISIRRVYGFILKIIKSQQQKIITHNQARYDNIFIFTNAVHLWDGNSHITERLRVC